MQRIIFPLLAGLLLAQPATAEIYKCRLPGGKTEISNSPCPSGSDTVMVRPDEAVPEANRQQAERDAERMRNYVDKRESAQRAEAAAERQAQAQRQTASSAPTRRYGDPDACLRDLAQQALEATQRTQLETECRSLIRSPAAQQPVYVVPGYSITHPHYPPPKPQPRPPQPTNPAPSGPSKVICAPGKPC